MRTLVSIALNARKPQSDKCCVMLMSTEGGEPTVAAVAIYKTMNLGAVTKCCSNFVECF